MTDKPEQSENRISAVPDAINVIRLFGGIRPAANLLGVAVSTVQGWKERGVIPQNRMQTVLEVAKKHGVDLTGVLNPNGAKLLSENLESNPNIPTNTAEDKFRKQTKKLIETENFGSTDKIKRSRFGFIGAIVAIISAILLAIFLGQQIWAPSLFSEFSLREKLPRSLVSLLSDGQYDHLEGRITELEEGLKRISSRNNLLESLPELSALMTRVEEIDRTNSLEIDLQEYMARLSILGGRLSAVEGQLNLGEASGNGKLVSGLSEAEIVALRLEISSLGERLSAIEKAFLKQGDHSSAVLVLAIGHLDAEINTGLPFSSSLERVQALTEGDHVVAGILASLEAWSNEGIPVSASLRLLFKPLLWEFDQKEGMDLQEDDWWQRVRHQIVGLVNIRRIGNSEELSLPEQIEAAMEGGDLKFVVTVMEDNDELNSEALQLWLSQVKARLTADTALLFLREHALNSITSFKMVAP